MIASRWAWICEGLLALPRYVKRAALVAVDLSLLLSVLWVSLSLRYGEIFVPPNLETLLLTIAGPLLTVGILWHVGIYKQVTRFIGRRGNAQILAAIGLAVLIWALAVFMVGQKGVPRTVIITYAAFGAVGILAVRVLIRILLERNGIRIADIRPTGSQLATLIYGADRPGIALLRSIRAARDRNVLGFVDSSPTLWRQYVSGLKVYPPSQIIEFVEQGKIREILVALPTNRRHERRKVLQELERFPISVKILPTYEDVASGQVSLNSLRPVDISDILGRDSIPPHVDLMRRGITGKSILVTGAGGSIGSELVRQIVVRAPRRLVLLDISESALYNIEFDARRLVTSDAASPEIKIVLGSATDAQLMDQVIAENGIQTIYHAAAYKHVPIVETNPFAGLENNVFGTVTAAQAALKHDVERFVLVSTDKAVRPTNIMGASKRLAEVALQSTAAANPGSTVFTMVRFGNVLESSGSVVPLFRRQIQSGGPITVTHPNVTRFFMSIPEAAELVIQAGAMASGGEVFLLHMGDPVRIDDLARLMVRLSNLEVRDESNPHGDIEIVYVGLRPGEKLYEELLIGASTQTTEHARIFKSDEPFLASEEMTRELTLLRQAIKDRDMAAVHSIMSRTVEGYRPRDITPFQKSPLVEAPGQILQTLH